ncbi:hypothetical protein BGW39_011501 [Mortierella sp. 14UC]|nr:hypothetical protein BGW39_011501 [Mortierella sp. 14UC]
MEEFPHFPSPSASDDDGNIDNDYYSESGDDNVEEDDDEGAVEDLAFQPGNNDNSATLLNGDANDVPFANASNNPSFSSNPRSDRKDSGVFIHDAEDGTIVKISPRAMFPFSSSSASESESESEAEPSDYSY